MPDDLPAGAYRAVTAPVEIGATYVIATLREQLADAHWQITLLRAQAAQLTAQSSPPPDVATPPADDVVASA